MSEPTPLGLLVITTVSTPLGILFITPGSTSIGLLVVAPELSPLGFLSYNPVSERILAVRLAMRPVNVTVTQVYEPPSTRSEEELYTFYEQLHNMVKDGLPGFEEEIILTTIRAVCKCVLTNMSFSSRAAGIPLQSLHTFVHA